MPSILMICTSHDVLGNTGRKTGMWLDEFTTPYYLFVDAGYDVVVASPRGGVIPIDPASIEPAALTESTRRFVDDRVRSSALYTSKPLARVRAVDFDAVFYPGGHGPMWDLANDPQNAMIALNFFDAMKPIGAVCHGPAALTLARKIGGLSILHGVNVTGFSNSEERAIGMAEATPFSLQDRLVELGGRYSSGGDFAEHVVVDHNIATGQNPISAAPTAKRVLELIAEQLRFQQEIADSEMRAMGTR